MSLAIILPNGWSSDLHVGAIQDQPLLSNLEISLAVLADGCVLSCWGLRWTWQRRLKAVEAPALSQGATTQKQEHPSTQGLPENNNVS